MRTRLAFRDDRFRIAARHNLKFVSRAISKKRLLGQIIEKGFFIESEKNLILQLCDLCVYTARRREEQELGLPVKPIDQGGR